MQPTASYPHYPDSPYLVSFFFHSIFYFLSYHVLYILIIFIIDCSSVVTRIKHLGGLSVSFSDLAQIPGTAPRKKQMLNKY